MRRFIIGCISLAIGACSSFKEPTTPQERASCCSSLSRNVATMLSHSDPDDFNEQAAIAVYQKEFYERCGCGRQ